MKLQLKALTIGTVSGALILGGLSSLPALAAPGDQAVITVSKSTGLNPDGETITVTGTGFVPDGTLTNATRPPLGPGFGGVYVSFGKFQDVWRPSASAPSANRLLTFADATRTKWLVPAANIAQIGGEAAGGAILAADGTFSVTINVSKILSASGTVVFDESTIGNYGIYTQTGGGARYAPFETFTPLTFSVPVIPTPTATPTAKPKATQKLPTIGSTVKVGKSFSFKKTTSANLPMVVTTSTSKNCRVAVKGTSFTVTGVRAGTCKLTLSQKGSSTANPLRATVKSIRVTS
jgi:hypothetical protein